MLKTALGRSYTQVLVFWLAADALIAFAVAYFFFADDLLVAFLVTIALLWLVPLLLKLKNLVVFSIWGMMSKDTIRSQLVREFRKNKLPLLSGSDFNDPADLYFQEVSEDDTLPKAARLFAAQTIG